MEALEHFTKYSNDPAAAMSWLHSKNIGREEDPDMPVALDVSDHRYASSQTLDGAKGSCEYPPVTCTGYQRQVICTGYY
mgnify:CR=1 FL=1